MSRPIPVRRSRYPGEFIVESQRRAVELLRGAAREYGDVVRLSAGRDPVYLVNHPDLIRDILVTQDRHFKKGRALERARRFLGNGLLTSEGDFHRRQRRMIQPAFHRRQIERYAEIMAAGALRAAERWRDGASVEVVSEMMAITMPIVAETLFGASLGSRTAEIGAALSTLVEQFRFTLLPGAMLVEKIPLPFVLRMRAAERTLHDTVAAIVQERRAVSPAGDGSGDLLSLLIEAQDEEVEASSAERTMTDQQIHDEVLTLFIAGHETTSVWLTWTWYLLAQHPDIESRLRDELSEVLRGAPPSVADVPRLDYTRRVLMESLRLYPPAWAIGRRCLADVDVGGYRLPAGCIVVISPMVTHVDPRFWPAPLTFDPDRWLDESAAADRPKFAFFPFGGGSRICIGEQFAWMEATLLLATLAQSWRLHLAPGARVEPRPMVTLRPRKGIPMRLEQVPHPALSRHLPTS